MFNETMEQNVFQQHQVQVYGMLLGHANEGQQEHLNIK